MQLRLLCSYVYLYSQHYSIGWLDLPLTQNQMFSKCSLYHSRKIYNSDTLCTAVYTILSPVSSYRRHILNKINAVVKIFDVKFVRFLNILIYTIHSQMGTIAQIILTKLQCNLFGRSISKVSNKIRNIQSTHVCLKQLCLFCYLE